MRSSSRLSALARLGCAVCGQHRTGGHGISYHAGRRAWAARYGEPEELLVRVAVRLEGAS